MLQAAGLLGDDQIVGDGAPQLAVGEGMLLLFGHQALGLDGIGHMEVYVFHQSHQGQLGVLISKGLQRVGGIFDDGLLLGGIGVDDDGHVRQSQQLGILRNGGQGHMAHQPLGAQAVLPIQHRHQKVAGGQVAAHEDVALSAGNDVDGGLGDIVAGGGVHHGVRLLLQPQLLQLDHGARPVAHQHGLHKALVLSLEEAPEHVLSVGTGQHHPQGGRQLGDTADDIIEILDLHNSRLTLQCLCRGAPRSYSYYKGRPAGIQEYSPLVKKVFLPSWGKC